MFSILFIKHAILLNFVAAMASALQDSVIVMDVLIVWMAVMKMFVVGYSSFHCTEQSYFFLY